MAVTAALNVGFWLFELRTSGKAQSKRIVMVATVVLLNVLSWYWGRYPSSGIGIVD
jgi:hypothetical protein